MKRLLSVAGLGLLMMAPISAQEQKGYDTEFKDAFMTECKAEVSATGCSCILSNLEKKVTQDQLTELYHHASSGNEAKFNEMSGLVKSAKEQCNVK